MLVFAALIAACGDFAPPSSGDPADPTPSPQPSEEPADPTPSAEPSAPAEEPSAEPGGSEEPEDPTDAPDDTLRAAAAAAGIEFGSAVASGPLESEDDYAQVLAREFSGVTSENVMKPEPLQPPRGEFDFAAADALIDFAKENDQSVRGHTLIWHKRTPDWVTEGDFTDDELRDILREHITEVVSHFRSDVVYWDVANEVIDDDAELRDTAWSHLGESYIADAFRWAHEADPDAKLYLNDYNIETINTKSDAYYELVQRLLDDGVPIHGIGMQMHISNGRVLGTLEENIQRFADLGLEVAITEADVRMELPVTDEKLATQADTYRRTVEACLAVPECVSYTVWGFTDRHSWVPGTFEGLGAATLMTEDLEPKPAYDAVLDALRAAAD
jgi:endo-1,4-beta-xylanase